jgi:polysaccharide export outer membrane protein
VFVDGDVANPGPYPFRPGLTVRDAVAIADGFDALQLRSAHGELGQFAVELVSQAVRVARLRAVLAAQTEIDLRNTALGPIAPGEFSAIVAVETEQLKTEKDEYDKSKDHLEQMIKETNAQISALDQAQQEETRLVAQLQKDEAHSRQLLERGLLQISRVEDQQRALSQAQFTLFDVMARASGARKELELLSREMQEAGSKRKLAALQELGKTLGEMAAKRARIEAMRETLVGDRGIGAVGGTPRYMTSSPASRPPPDGVRDPRQYEIVRKAADGQQQRIAADEETRLQPGDRIEVRTLAKHGALVAPPDAAILSNAARPVSPQPQR